MTIKRGLIYGLATVLLIGGWFLIRRRDKHIDQAIKSTILAPTDQAKIIVDPRHHTITTVTAAKGTQSTFLPQTGASITVDKKGVVRVATRSWGTEVSPFMGGALGMDIKLRAAMGLNLFYWTRWEFGAGLLSGGLKDTRLFVHVSFNVYDNWYVGLGADNRATAHLMAGLKF